MRMKIIIIWILLFCGSALASLRKHDMRLERVAIIYYDSKYIKDAMSFTSRSKRGDTYKTNFTGTLLHEWGSNVTGIIYYKAAENNVENVLLSEKICEAFKLKWIANLTEKYSNIPTSCNVPPGEYHVVNMELKPHNFPLPLPSGQHYVGVLFVLTKTKHVLFNAMGTVHVIV